MHRIALAAALLSAVSSGALAESHVIHSGACAVDAELVKIPACALDVKGGTTKLLAPFLPLYFPTENKNGLVPLLLPDTGWSYIDHTGLVVVGDVATMDNGAGEFHRGLVRVTRAGKWGLANEQGKLITPLRYDGMNDYEAGKGWHVCTGCTVKTGGEHSWFDGGTWAWINPAAR